MLFLLQTRFFFKNSFEGNRKKGIPTIIISGLYSSSRDYFESELSMSLSFNYKYSKNPPIMRKPSDLRIYRLKFGI